MGGAKAVSRRRGDPARPGDNQGVALVAGLTFSPAQREWLERRTKALQDRLGIKMQTATLIMGILDKYMKETNPEDI